MPAPSRSRARSRSDRRHRRRTTTCAADALLIPTSPPRSAPCRPSKALPGTTVEVESQARGRQCRLRAGLGPDPAATAATVAATCAADGAADSDVAAAITRELAVEGAPRHRVEVESQARGRQCRLRACRGPDPADRRHRRCCATCAADGSRCYRRCRRAHARAVRRRISVPAAPRLHAEVERAGSSLPRSSRRRPSLRRSPARRRGRAR